MLQKKYALHIIGYHSKNVLKKKWQYGLGLWYRQL